VSPLAREPNLPVVDDLDDVVQLVTDRPSIFVRYSRGPAADNRDGPSRDYEADVDMPGLSVTTVAPEPWWPRSPRHWVARRLCQYDQLGDQEGRFAWLLTGRVVGWGPDHEPLVVDVEPIARVGPHALREAQRVYQEHFTVAKDSRPRLESS
jgi:hypothetical protein